MTKYHKAYKGIIDVIDFNDGSIRNKKGLIEAGLTINGAQKPPTEDETKKAVAKERKITIACVFILGADKTQFGKLMEDMEKSFTQCDDKYPVDLTEAYKLLTNWKHFVPPACRSAPIESSFTNVGT